MGEYFDAAEGREMMVLMEMLKSQERGQISARKRSTMKGSTSGHRVLLTWAMHVLFKMDSKNYLHTETFRQLISLIFEYRQACALTVDTNDRPIPFAYFHGIPRLLLQPTNYLMPCSAQSHSQPVPAVCGAGGASNLGGPPRHNVPIPVCAIAPGNCRHNGEAIWDGRDEN